MKKLNGVGTAGIVLNIISVILPIAYGGYLFSLMSKTNATLPLLTSSSHLVFQLFVIVPFSVSFLVLFLSIITLVTKSNGAKITLGIFSLINTIFVWIFFVFPLILALVGGILTLCGKFQTEDKKSK